MSKTQLDLELDATGIEEQLGDLAAKAVTMGSRWLLSIDHKTGHPTLSITDPVVIDLLQQAAAMQHLINLLLKRKGG
jgi:hypothetical protein